MGVELSALLPPEQPTRVNRVSPANRAAMNFTSDVKKELMKLPCGKEESRAALSAYFSACGVFAESGTGEPEFFLVSETERVAEFFTGLFYNLFGERLIVSRAVKDRLSGRSRLILECPRGAKNALETLELYKPGAGFTVGVPQVFKKNDAARRAYICGAFLGGGSITLPADGKKTGYHLEIAFPAEEDGESAVAEEFAALAETDDFAAENGIGLSVFSPLYQGFLTGKYLNGIPEDSRVGKGNTWIGKELDDKMIKRLNTLNVIAAQRGQTLSQMALSWVLRNKAVTTVLIGASRPEQIIENVKCIEHLDFTDDELDRIEAALK